MADNNEKSATGSDELEAKVLARYASQESRVREARRAQYSEFVAALELSVARDYAESPSKLLEVLSTQPGWFQTLAGKRQLAILFTFVQSDRQVHWLREVLLVLIALVMHDFVWSMLYRCYA